MKKVLIILLIVFMVTSFSFAAGGSQASGKVELNFLEVMTSPSRTEVLNGMIAEYERLNPNVTINLISPPYEQADNRLTLSLQAQEPLDVIEVRNLTATSLVNNKWLTDLTPYLGKWNEYNTLLPVVTEAARAVDGTPYLLPQWFFIKALFLRTDILKNLGITQYPTTLEELYAMAKRITNQAQNQFGFTLRGRGNPFKAVDLLLLADVPNIDTNNLYALKNGTSTFDTPEFLAGLKNFVDLYKNAVPPDGINWGFNDQINAFVSGITPFLVQDPDTVSFVDQHLTRDQYTVIPMPVGRNTGTIYVEYGYAGYSIPSYSKNKDAAWNFIAWFSSYPQNSHFCKAYGALPIHSTSYTADAYYSSGVYQAWQATMNNPGKYIGIKYPYSSQKFAGWAQVYDQYYQSTLLGRTTPEETAKAWSDYWK